MTIEDRYVIDVDELGLLRLDCARCASAVTLHVDDVGASRMPTSCPQCGVAWSTRDAANGVWQGAAELLNALQSLRYARTHAAELADGHAGQHHRERHQHVIHHRSPAFAGVALETRANLAIWNNRSI